MTMLARDPRASLLKPGDALRRILLKNSITQDQLAQAMKVSRYTINELVNHRRTVTAEMALRLGRALGIDPRYWLELQLNVDLWEATKALAPSLKYVERLLPGDK